MERVRQVYAQVTTRAYLRLLTWKVATFAFVYLNLWALFGDDALPPNGTYFHLFMIFIAAHLCAKLAYLASLPGLFGMLVAGFIYGNAFDIELDKTITSGLRSLALMIILLRAGLSLDPTAIKRLSFVCFRLAFGPCIVEAITVAVVAYFIFDLPIAWSLMLGFVLAAVSPAVVVPGMIRLQSAKLGTSKGIPTLIIAAASIDDVLAITGFSVCLSFAFSSTSNDDGSTWKLIWSILKGPTEALVGIMYGLVVGILLWYVPELCTNNRKASKNYAKFDLYRLALLLLTGVFALFGSQKFELSGSGPLAILVAPFVASLRWRPAGMDTFNEDALKRLWLLFQHYLFCLIGADVRLKTLESDVLIYGLVCLAVGIALRIGAAFLVTYGNGLNYRERLFTAIAWLPKATVQAAIGPVALDIATTDEERKRGRLVLTIAVLSILITAPLGAIAIDYCARFMLTSESQDARAVVDAAVREEEEATEGMHQNVQLHRKNSQQGDSSHEESSSIEMELK